MKDKKEILLEVLYRHNKGNEIEKLESGDYKEEVEIIYEAMEEYASQPFEANIKYVKKEEL